MIGTLETLTDFEEAALHSRFCLADGHAYQDLHPAFVNIIQDLPSIWENSMKLSIPESENLFHRNFSDFINSPILKNFESNFKICPTASNSIDIVGATLNQLNLNVVMVEPTFDNLALLLRRRGVNLSSINDSTLFQAAEVDNIESVLPDLKKLGALVLVHPNNPTGLTLSENGFRNVVKFCERNNIILVIDNCFRVYRKKTFDDYKILITSGASFITVEDTGKVWPTQDLKVSLVYFSNDLKPLFCEIYNEIYLCVSNLSLSILGAFLIETTKVGLKNAILDVVDKRRVQLRKVIAGSSLQVNDIAINSNLPVEWISCAATHKNDFTICHELKELNLAVLPGRQFYWNSSQSVRHQNSIRISLLRPEASIGPGFQILQQYCNTLNKNNLRDPQLLTA